jgi:Flp pilus assembly protein TadG
VAKTENTLRNNRPQFPKPASPGKQMGVIAIMFAGALVIIIGFFVLALDLSMLYNRKMELQNAADTLALAAAHELNGTSAGISKALQKASERFTNPSTGHVTYGYGKQNMNCCSPKPIQAD